MEQKKAGVGGTCCPHRLRVMAAPQFCLCSWSVCKEGIEESVYILQKVNLIMRKKVRMLWKKESRSLHLQNSWVLFYISIYVANSKLIYEEQMAHAMKNNLFIFFYISHSKLLSWIQYTDGWISVSYRDHKPVVASQDNVLTHAFTNRLSRISSYLKLT